MPAALIKPDLNSEFHIFSDACEISLAGYLGQEKDGDFGVIAYASRRIKPSELSLSMFQLELLAFLCINFQAAF